MKKFLAVVLALVGSVAIASPASAATPSDYSDVRFMLNIMKVTWIDLDYMSQESLCDYYYLSPRNARDDMAETFNDPSDGAFSEYSLYDVKRATWRLLKWAC